MDHRGGCGFFGSGPRVEIIIITICILCPLRWRVKYTHMTLVYNIISSLIEQTYNIMYHYHLSKLLLSSHALMCDIILCICSLYHTIYTDYCFSDHRVGLPMIEKSNRVDDTLSLISSNLSNRITIQRYISKGYYNLHIRILWRM